MQMMQKTLKRKPIMLKCFITDIKWGIELSQQGDENKNTEGEDSEEQVAVLSRTPLPTFNECEDSDKQVATSPRMPHPLPNECEDSDKQVATPPRTPSPPTNECEDSDNQGAKSPRTPSPSPNESEDSDEQVGTLPRTPSPPNECEDSEEQVATSPRTSSPSPNESEDSDEQVGTLPIMPSHPNECEDNEEQVPRKPSPPPNGFEDGDKQVATSPESPPPSLSKGQQENEIIINKLVDCDEQIRMSPMLPLPNPPLTERINPKVFIATGLDRRELLEVDRLAKLTGCQFSSIFHTQNTTHVIIKTDAELVCCRTLKYLKGISARLWIVSYTWVEACLKVGYLLPEEGFEVQGDVDCGRNHNGPKRARMSKSPLLMHSYEICHMGEYSSLNKDQIESLLKLCGATVVQHPTIFPLLYGHLSCIIVQNYSNNKQDYYNDLYKQYSVPVISIDWLLDSISTYCLQPIDDFILSGKTLESDHDDADSYVSLVDASNSEYLPESTSECYSDTSDASPILQMKQHTGVKNKSNHQQGESSGEHKKHKKHKKYSNKDNKKQETCFLPGYQKSKCLKKTIKDKKHEMAKKHKKHKIHTKPSKDKKHKKANEHKKDKKHKKHKKDKISEKNREVQISKRRCGKRLWTNKDYCFFCGKADFKVARHWSIWHKQERMVIEVEALPKSSRARREKIAFLRNKGNLKHNFTVWETGEGKIVPRKRPSNDDEASEYLPCEFCDGSFKKVWLPKHQKTCVQRCGRERQQRVQSPAKMMIPERNPQTVSDSLRTKVLSRMQSDSITAVVTRDDDILAYGTQMLRSHPEEHHALIISQKMRDLAKLVSAASLKDPAIIGIRDCIDPQKFDTVVAAVKDVAGYSSQSNSYRIPSYARNIGFEINKVASQIEAEAMISNNKQLDETVKNFKEVKLSEWRNTVTVLAHHSLQSSRRNRPNLLPLAEDLKNLANYLQDNRLYNEMALREDPCSTKNWQEFCHLTLTRVSLFNKRRSGETERLLLDDYKKGCQDEGEIPQEIYKSLTEVEKGLVLQLQRIEVRGKRGRTVPILLTKEMVFDINLLNETREDAGVSKENPYVFARPYFGSVFPVKISECYRKFAEASGAKNPDAIRSTKLRKHIAIMSQLLCLKEIELDLLATYMGHDVRVYREFYILPECTLQLAKVSKLLILIEKGEISDFKGKSLDEIEIPLDASSEGEEDTSKDNVVACEHVEGEDNKKTIKKKKMRKYVPRRPWSSDEKAVVTEYFKDAIVSGVAPKIQTCKEVKTKNPILNTRTWQNIRDFVVAERKRKLRKMSKQQK
ncbi:uncharacterized protein LOC117116888 [Anneissia japonica]|uniref:uncharacterized protein LOC117116888 n=1 Tax=Anneissia japonica TaxID=1529436 RepID=UPI0014258F61|nr:uncharacterized protein LOC117116888 [Anneissia japonica]XP_033116899.1 uncharacterized protein LOC117116888 [Anneissia japonica]XP_033116900.1 uncharacterized protein LOC117116888 [Anneissia japonica]